ncbi:MAG: outer membrane beta-barrel protein [Pelobium sp.]
MMKTVFTTILLLCSFLLLSAQHLSLKGSIIDSLSQQPLSYATISLNSNDKILKSMLSDEQGNFEFTALEAKEYQLSFVNMGYLPKDIAADLRKLNNPLLDMGIIKLVINKQQLKEVVITVAKPLVKQEADRISYDLQTDPESKAKNVLEMMKKVPLLSLDAEDNIQLKGSGSFKILINGKPSGLIERNPKEVLRSMPASSIEKIEVITTPPAKYDGEGLAGIINIITHKDVANGYNASMNAKQSFVTGGPSIGGSYTFKSGKLGITSYGGLAAYQQPMTIQSFNRETSGSNANTLYQNGERSNHSRNGYINAELSYELDSLNLISGQLGYNQSHSFNAAIQYSETIEGDVLQQRYSLGTVGEGNGDGLDLAINYQLGFKSNKNRMLTFSYRYFKYKNSSDDGLAVNDAFQYDLPDYQQYNDGRSSEQTFQLDYTHPYKKLVIEAGLKGILRANNSDFSYWAFNNQSGIFVEDSGRSNAFRNSQDVIGFYNSYQYKLKDWAFKGGIRVEKTFIDANFISTNSQLQQDYLNFIPSISINRNFKNGHSVSLGFNTRMQRPGIYQLNPFVDRSNPAFERSGNPDLHPTTGKILQLSYSHFKKANMNTSIGYMFINDLVMPLSIYNAATQVTRTTYGNTGGARLLTFNFYINQPITKLWSFNFSTRLNYGKVEGMVNGVKEANEGLMPGGNFSTSYKFESGWGMNGSFYYNGKDINLQGGGNSYAGVSLSINKDLIKNKLSFSASANNFLTKYRYNRNFTEGLNFAQRSEDQNYARTFSLSLNYRFGELKGGIKKSKKSISNDDVSGGIK